jgi:hypothetical protein
MGYIPILTAGTAEITSHASQGKPLRSRVIMKDRFLFDRVYRKCRDLSIYQAIQFSAFVCPCLTPTLLTFGNNTFSLAGEANDLSIIKFMV